MRASLPSVAVALLLVPGTALATIGMAERHSELRYGTLAAVRWIHPGDGCDCGRECFTVVRRDRPGGAFAGLAGSLCKVNAPAREGPWLLFAQGCCDGRWLVYDLERERYLAQGASYERALGAWRAAGLDEPRFADARDGARGLSQTWASRLEGATWMALLWLPALALGLLPVCVLGSLFFLVRYLRRRRARDLVVSLLLFLPSLPGLWFVWKLLEWTVLRRGR